MKKFPPINETKRKTGIIMGFFGDKTETINVNQASANGQATADVKIAVPI
jgi:hypothetical protein